MATFIKGQDCECPDCGSTPCESGCQCIFDFLEFDPVTSGYDEFDYAYNVIGQTAIAKDMAITWDIAFSGGFARLIVSADNVPIYDSGCVGVGLYTATVTVPANTLEIEAYVEQQCSGTWVENAWEFRLLCEDA